MVGHDDADFALQSLTQRINDERLLERPYAQRAMLAAEVPSIRRGQRPKDHPGKPLTGPQIANAFNVGLSDFHRFRRVLEQGTAEEIEQVRAGTIAVQSVYDDLRLGIDAESRKRRREVPVPDRVRRPPPGEAKMQAEIWVLLRGALQALASMPLPADVAKLVRAIPSRAMIADRLTERDLKWLTEFAHAYTRRTEPGSSAGNGEENGQAHQQQ